MTKKKDKIRAAVLYENLQKLSLSNQVEEEDKESPLDLSSIQGQEIQLVADTSPIQRMKRFRHQLLHQWLIHTYQPCKTADIGGGKGLLSYLLNQSGWQVTVIDPVQQPLPGKYKDILANKRIKIFPQAQVPQILTKFEIPMAEPFDLLIGMHAHGCNVKILDAAAVYGCGFVIFPCCVIDEPFYPPLGVHWLESLAGYALKLGHTITPFRLNFKGQNIGLFSPGKCQLVR